MEWISPIMIVSIALILSGIAGRIRTRGAGLFRPVDELLALMRRRVNCGIQNTQLSRVAPAVCLGSTFLALLFVPVGMAGAPLHFGGDMALFAGLLTFARLMPVLVERGEKRNFADTVERVMLSGFALMLILGTLAVLTGRGSLVRIFALAGTLGPAGTVVLVLSALLLVAVVAGESDAAVTVHEGRGAGLIMLSGWLRSGVLAVLAGGMVAATFAYHVAVIYLLALCVGAVAAWRQQLTCKKVRMRVVAVAALSLFAAVCLLKQAGVNF